MKLFEYVYFRMYKAFFKWDGKSASRALIGVTSIQTLLVGELIMLTFRMFFTLVQLKPYSKILAWSILLIGFVFFVLNFKKYTGNFEKYNERWKNESENLKKLNGFLVVLSLILPWVFLCIIGFSWSKHL